MRIISIILWLLLSCSSSISGGRGGHSTTFDCNVWGGSCACFLSQASGKCSNATAHFSNASCTGGDDSVALADWLTYAQALTTIAVLYIPPGSNCVFGGGDGNSSFVADVTIHCAGFGAQPITTVRNAVVWGYGTTITNIWFGGLAFFNARNTQGIITGCGSGPTNTSPLIQAANAGDISITLMTPAESSNFTVGDWIVITALSNQNIGSFPPNHTFHEHALVKAINSISGVLTLGSPLQFSYKTTYPDLGGTQPYEGGPATIYLLEKTYNNNSQYFGLNILDVNQSNIVGRNVVIQDVVWSNSAANGPNPTQSESIWIVGSAYPASEIDKEIGLLAIINSNVRQSDVQSSAINNFIIQGSKFSILNGLPAQVSIVGSTISSLRAGPTCCGVGRSVSLDGVSLASVLTEFHFSLISAYSFSSGTLTISKAATEYTNGKSPGLWVLGHKYFVGDSDGSNTCVPANTFTVTDVQDAGANVNIITDLPSVTFGNTCGAGTRPPTTYGAYQSMSLTQKFSGPANLLSNPEMLPP